MTVLRAQELARMRASQADLYHDTCRVLQWTAAGIGNWGPMAQPSYPAQSASSCGFKPGSVKEVMDNGQVVMQTPQLRLPIGTTVTERDRIEITHRYGAELDTPEVYAITGIRRGPSGLVLDLETCTEEELIER